MLLWVVTRKQINLIHRLLATNFAVESLPNVCMGYEAMMIDLMTMSFGINYELKAVTHCNHFERPDNIICELDMKKKSIDFTPINQHI